MGIKPSFLTRHADSKLSVAPPPSKELRKDNRFLQARGSHVGIRPAISTSQARRGTGGANARSGPHFRFRNTLSDRLISRVYGRIRMARSTRMKRPQA